MHDQIHHTAQDLVTDQQTAGGTGRAGGDR
jgi:hypothetical protein